MGLMIPVGGPDQDYCNHDSDREIDFVDDDVWLPQIGLSLPTVDQSRASLYIESSLAY